MDNTLTQSAPKTDAKYKAEFEEAMAEIRQHEATFDRLHAEIVAMQHDDELQDSKDTLVKVLYEFDKDRALAERDRQIAERDREILLLRLESALKNDPRALLSSSNAQNAPEAEARFAALEKEIAELKNRVAALENAA